MNSAQRLPIAIVGMSCVFPQAKGLKDYWENLLAEVDCITEVPASRWSLEDYYDSDPKCPDKTYCRRGGFIPDIDFDPLEFGLPPNILEVTDVSQLLGLVVAKAALQDAGYLTAVESVRQRTGVVLGIGGGQKLITPLTSRLQYPIWERVLRQSGIAEAEIQSIIQKIQLAYVPWEENSFPGLLGNVIAGRIANRFDLGGMNCVVDAACASSLAAVRMALSELAEGRSDMMITGGVDTDNSIFMYLCFSKTPAFSEQQIIRPFDAKSDGMLIGEGIGMLVLKRLDDAERDGDRIYAVIKGMGTSSDGKYKSIYAPRSSGQTVALRRAYQDAGFSPTTVGLIEAHGTGTLAGDPVEFAALNEVFSEGNAQHQHIALGSVKSQIGHTKSAAGVASLIKTALALYHQILPATIHVTEPNPKLKIEHSPFYLNTETRPWIQSADGSPRRAGVSSFGFGGTNYHLVLEEYLVPSKSQLNQWPSHCLHSFPAAVVVEAPTAAELLVQCESLLAQLQSDNGESCYATLVQSQHPVPTSSARVGFVVRSRLETCDRLNTTIHTLKHQPNTEAWSHPQGIYYRQSGVDTQGTVVALFSGQGSQSLNMGKALALNFPEIRDAFAQMDRLLYADDRVPISQRVFPIPVFTPEQQSAQLQVLQQTQNAQPAIGALCVGIYTILQSAGFQPDFVAGHSFGELTALWAAGALTRADYFSLVKARGQAMAAPADPLSDPGRMLAVTGEIAMIATIMQSFQKVAIANWNSCNQVVVAGATQEITQLQNTLEQKGCSTVLLPVSAAFHTAFVAHAQKPFARAVQSVQWRSPEIPVYANATAAVYPTDPVAIAQTIAAQMLKPVRFKEEIEAIYAAGGRIFVEVGPRNTLTNLVQNILADRPFVAIALNPSRQKDSDRQLQDAIVQLRVIGLPLTRIGSHSPNSSQPPTLGPLKKGLSVQLNGSNYVSEATKLAFERALEYIPQKPGHSSKHASPTTLNAQPQNQTSAEINVPPQPTPSKTEISASASLQPSVSVSLSFRQPSMSNYPSDADSFERLMMRFYEHQAALLNGHEQFLRNQQETSQQFLQLMQQRFAGEQPQPMIPFTLPQSKTEQPIHPSEIVNGKDGLHTETQPPSDVALNVAQLTNENGSVNSSTESTINDRSSDLTGGQQAIAPVQSATETVNISHLADSLLEVVSDKTGYPVEILEIGMDMEAELGIDSIKRVEILGAMQDLFPDLPPVNAEDLAELRTLQQVVNYLEKQGIATKKKIVTSG